MMALAWGGTFEVVGGRDVAWNHGDQRVVLDLYEQALTRLEDVPFADRTMPTRPYTGSGVVVSREREAEVVVRPDGAMVSFWNGVRQRRTWLPEHWDLSKTVFGQHLTLGVALHEGELLIPTKRARYDLVQVEATELVVGSALAVFPDSPQHWLPLHQRAVSTLPALRFDQIKGSAGRFVARHDGRAVVWDSGGQLLFIDSEDSQSRRLSEDGTLLATVSANRTVRVVDVDDQTVTLEQPSCAGKPFPHTNGAVTVVCADALWHGWGTTVLALDRPPGEVRRITARDGALAVVTGAADRMGEVWSVPLDGGPSVRVRAPAQGHVQGFRRGRPIQLGVRAIDGRPVERATAAKFESMRDAARVDGVTLHVASGFRTMNEQQVLYDCWQSGDCNNGNLAARPGHSRHQSGQALDLNTHVPEVLAWLTENGSDYGFYRTVRSEPWHWEYHGRTAPVAVTVAQLPPTLATDPPDPNIPWDVVLLD